MTVGTRVVNQDTDQPLTGVVIATPDGQAEPDGWVWVSWSNGLVCEEYPLDITAVVSERVYDLRDAAPIVQLEALED